MEQDNGNRFDEMAKALGSETSTRRAALRRLGGGALGVALAGLGLGGAVAADRGDRGGQGGQTSRGGRKGDRGRGGGVAAANVSYVGVSGTTVFNGTTTRVADATVILHRCKYANSYWCRNNNAGWIESQRTTSNGSGNFAFSSIQVGYDYYAYAYRSYGPCQAYWGNSVAFYPQRSFGGLGISMVKRPC